MSVKDSIKTVENDVESVFTGSTTLASNIVDDIENIVAKQLGATKTQSQAVIAGLEALGGNFSIAGIEGVLEASVPLAGDIAIDGAAAAIAAALAL